MPARQLSLSSHDSKWLVSALIFRTTSLSASGKSRYCAADAAIFDCELAENYLLLAQSERVRGPLQLDQGLIHDRQLLAQPFDLRGKRTHGFGERSD